MEAQKVSRNDLTGFMASQNEQRNFEDFIRRLLSTFMSEEYLKIYMSKKVEKVVKTPSPLPSAEKVAYGVTEKGDPGLGPFYIIMRAFMHRNVSTISLENLETLGDVVLNEAAVMIITTTWPNLLNQALQVADMKRYYTNNTNAALYAKELGFIRWIVRTKEQGLNSKERADVFESFIGAIVMIGEFFIGEQVGLALARLFLNKFFLTRKWYPEDTEFYAAPQGLWNDYKTSLNLEDSKKPRLMPAKPKPQRTPDGRWFISATLADPKGLEDGEVKRRTGRAKVRFQASARNKDDAKTELYQQIIKKMNIQKSEFAAQRESKREKDPEIGGIMLNINAWAKEHGKTLEVPAKQQRGGKVFSFIREIKTSIVGNKELTYSKTVASGIGDTEAEALTQALEQLKLGNPFRSIAGTDESWNPDEDEQRLSTQEKARKAREEEDDKIAKAENIIKLLQKHGVKIDVEAQRKALTDFDKLLGREEKSQKEAGEKKKYTPKSSTRSGGRRDF